MQLRGDSIRISLACNWKLDLLDLIEKDENIRRNVYDFYGTHDMSFTGSGRPFFLMAKRGKSEIRDQRERRWEDEKVRSWEKIRDYKSGLMPETELKENRRIMNKQFRILK